MLTYDVLSGRSSRQIATTSSAKGGRDKNDADMDADMDMDADVDFVSGEDGDGDDGGVCVVLGVKLALDETDESDRSDNCGELVAPVPLYLKYAF